MSELKQGKYQKTILMAMKQMNWEVHFDEAVIITKNNVSDFQHLYTVTVNDKSIFKVKISNTDCLVNSMDYPGLKEMEFVPNRKKLNASAFEVISYILDVCNDNFILEGKSLGKLSVLSKFINHYPFELNINWISQTKLLSNTKEILLLKYDYNGFKGSVYYDFDLCCFKAKFFNKNDYMRAASFNSDYIEEIISYLKESYDSTFVLS